MQISENSNQSSISFDFRQYTGLLWHWAWVILLAFLLAVGAAFIASKLITPVYSAKTTILVNEASASRTIDINSVTLSEDLAQTYSQIMNKSMVLDEVASRLLLSSGIDPKTISVQPVQNTQLITISVESTNPALAAQIANTIVLVFSDKIHSLQAERFSASKESLQTQLADVAKQIQTANNELSSTTVQTERDRLETNITDYQQIYSGLLQTYEQVRLAEAQTISSVVQIEPAKSPDLPVRPNILQNMALAGLVSLLLSAGLVFILDMLDDTLKTSEEITQNLGLPVLGVITHFRAKDGLPITHSQPTHPVSEAYRTLRTNLQYADSGIDKPIKSILVTSPMKGEGKTTTAVNLGVVLAQNGCRVTLVDADLRQPEVHRSLELPNHTGLSQVLIQAKRGLDGLIQSTKVNDLFALTSGSLPPNPSELLGSEKMGAVLIELKALSEFVLIDSPPALAVTDASVLVPFVDGVLLVVKPGTTRLAAARQMVGQLRRCQANILGVVLNNFQLNRSSYGDYSYQYTYTDSQKKSARKH